MFRQMLATCVKNRIGIRRAYPWAFFLSRTTGGISAVVFPYFIYHYFLGGNLSAAFYSLAGGADYMTYIVLGAALNVLAVSSLMNIGRALITELREGTLEALLLSPGSRTAYFLGCLVEQTSRALLEFAVVLVFGALLGANVARILTLPALAAVLLAIFSFFCMGLLLSSVMLYTRDTYITQNTLFNTMTLLCGVAFPKEYLPGALQMLARLLPLTPAVALFRAVVVGGSSLAANAGDVLHILALSVAYMLAGLLWFRRLEKSLVETIFG